jgi:hypothetical protein
MTATAGAADYRAVLVLYSTVESIRRDIRLEIGN